MYVYCDFLLLTSKETMFGPPLFGLATPPYQKPNEVFWVDGRTGERPGKRFCIILSRLLLTFNNIN